MQAVSLLEDEYKEGLRVCVSVCRFSKIATSPSTVLLDYFQAARPGRATPHL